MSKKSAKKFANQVLAKWKNLNSEEIDSWIQQNFENSWEKFAEGSSDASCFLNLD